MFYLRLVSFVLCLVVLTSCTIEDYNPSFPSEKQIAHRGYWTAGAHENSLQAMQYAIDAGLYGAEIDVYETTDGVLVVNHDATYNGVNIVNSTYANILAISGANVPPIPCLADFLELLMNFPKFKLIIEIKSIHKIENLIHLIEQYNVSNQVELISFSKMFCDMIIDYDRKYVVGYLGGDISPKNLAAEGYDIIDLSYTIYLASPEIIADAIYYGLDVYAWTVNDAYMMATLYNMGVSRITTDVPRISR